MQSNDPLLQLIIGAGKGLGAGLNPTPALEQQALNQLFGGGREPTLEEILSAGLPLDKSRELAGTVSQARQTKSKAEMDELKKLQQQQQDIDDLAAINQERARQGKPALPPNISPVTARSLTQPDVFEKESDKVAASRVGKFLENQATVTEKLGQSSIGARQLKKQAEEGSVGMLTPGGLLYRITGLETEGVGKFNAARVAQFNQISSIFPGRILDREVAIVEKGIANPDDTQATIIAKANFAIALDDLNAQKNDIIEQIITENGGSVPNNLDREVQKRFRPLRVAFFDEWDKRLDNPENESKTEKEAGGFSLEEMDAELKRRGQNI